MYFQFDQKKLRYVQRVLGNRVIFKIVMLFQVPLNFLTGMRIRELNEESCQVTVPYRWRNKNPFKSTFWAVLGMAAELSPCSFGKKCTQNRHAAIDITHCGRT